MEGNENLEFIKNDSNSFPSDKQNRLIFIPIDNFMVNSRFFKVNFNFSFKMKLFSVLYKALMQIHQPKSHVIFTT